MEFLRYNIRRGRHDQAQRLPYGFFVKAFVCTVQLWTQVLYSRRRVDDNQKEKVMAFLIFSIIIAGLLVLVAPRFIPPQLSILHLLARAAAVLLILFAVASTSFVYIDEDKTGNINKIYGSNLPQGAYIAVNGEKGPQAYILPPGFQFTPLHNLLNT